MKAVRLVGELYRRHHDMRPPRKASWLFVASQIAEDEAEEVPPPEDTIEELYVMLRTSIVGVQYYKGLVGPGEEVRLVRQPNNQYDR